MIINSLIILFTFIFFSQIPLPQLEFQPANYILRTFYHADILHLLANMITLYQLNSLTQHTQSRNQLIQIIAFSWIGSSLLLYLVHKFLGQERIAIGFSGVLFSLIIINEYLRTNQFLTFSGQQISEILPQILFPGISFLGHLTGILTGIGYSTITKP